MASNNREIKSDGNVIIKGLTYPSADGSANQVLKTNGSGVLSFGDAGDVDVDTIASASDATNYTGTARFINITSTASVTFTNATIRDRIIYCDTNITVKFQCDNFINNIVKMSHATGTLQIESKYDGGDVGASKPNLVLFGCDIQCLNTLTLKSGSHDPSGSGEEARTLSVQSSSIKASTINFDSIASDPSDQSIVIEESNVNCSILNNTTALDNTTEVRFGSNVVCRYAVGFFDVDDGGIIHCLEGSNGSTVRIDTTGTTYINGVCNFPFTAKDSQVQTEIIARAINTQSQTISTTDSAKVEFDTAPTNIGSCFDTTNDKFVCKVKGLYGVKSYIYTHGQSSSSTSANPKFRLMHTPSGGSQAEHDQVNGFLTPGYDSRIYFDYSDLISLNVGDEIEMQVESSDGNYTVGTGGTRFNIYKIN
tara:strand:+ start:193 stop:1461 length:1269 start_codon:yes stop_codon:yes gene_type:complete